MGSGNVVTARFVLGLLWGLKNESKRSSLLLWLVCKGGTSSVLDVHRVGMQEMK